MVTIIGCKGSTFANGDARPKGGRVAGAAHQRMFRRNFVLCVSVAGALAAAGCGGGGSSPGPNPQPTPTSTPTQTPNTLVLAPTSFAINGAGSAYAQTLTVSEASYAGAFAESDTCSGIATIAPGAGTGPSLAETVTGVASGTCAVTFSDGHGQKTSATIVVTISSVIVN
jgi:hypothetical protein